MIQAPIATLKRVNGVAGLPLTFTLVQQGRATDGNVLAHGVRAGDTIIAATDMVAGTDLKAKFTSPAADAGLLEQSDSNTDHSAAIVMFLIQRG